MDSSESNRQPWWNMTVRFYSEKTTIGEILKKFNEAKDKDANTYWYYLDAFDTIINNLREQRRLTQKTYDEMYKAIYNFAVPYLDHWSEVFKTRIPDNTNVFEMRIWNSIGNQSPKNGAGAQNSVGVVQQSTKAKNVENSHTCESETASNGPSSFPSFKEFSAKGRNQDEICESIRKWADGHPGLSKEEKVQFNVEVCGAAGMDWIYKF